MAKQNLRELAKLLWVHNDSAQVEIAGKLGVTEKTVSLWRKKDGWDLLKKNLPLEREYRLQGLYDELAEFERMIRAKGATDEEGNKKGFAVATSKEADARSKLIGAIANLERKYNVADAITVGKDFTSFLRDIDMDTANKVVIYFDAFLQEKIKKAKWDETL